MRQPHSLSRFLLVGTCSFATLFLVGCQSRQQSPTGTGAPAPVCPCGGTDSWGKPIKGGGGAMTLFSKHKWQRADAGYCTEFDPRVLSTSPEVTSGGFDKPLPSPFTGSWQLLGHDPQTGQASQNGLELTLQSSGCQGEIGRTSMMLHAIGDTHSGVGFYARPLPLRVKDGDNKRFQDKSGACATDEDLCERMAAIQTSTDKYTCVDGDCDFTIGP